MHHTFIQQLAQLSRWLLPSQCLHCYATTTHASNLCALCQQELPILPQKCVICAQILPSEQKNSPAISCHCCSKNTLPYGQLFAAYAYQPPISHWVSQLKFQQQLTYARLFGQLLIDKINRAWYQHRKLPDLIIPVPLHPQRLRERGFNQALEIARPIAQAYHIPIDAHGITRSKATLAQSGLSSHERQRNITDAFTAHRHYQGLTIAVLDDVVTTGHTIRELSQLLKSQGARTIDIWCCARVF